MNTYEALVLIKADIKDEDAKNVTKSVTDTITKHGGVIQKEEDWGKRQLAYRLKKAKEGRYFKVNFTVAPSEIVKIEGVYKLNGDILRTMITKR